MAGCLSVASLAVALAAGVCDTWTVRRDSVLWRGRKRHAPLAFHAGQFEETRGIRDFGMVRRLSLDFCAHALAGAGDDSGLHRARLPNGIFHCPTPATAANA